MVDSATIAKDGKTLATASWDGTARIWDITGNLRDELEHEESVHILAFSPDGSILATASYDKTMRLWDVPTGQLRGTFPHDRLIRSVAFTKNGTIIATGCSDAKRVCGMLPRESHTESRSCIMIVSCLLCSARTEVCWPLRVRTNLHDYGR